MTNQKGPTSKSRNRLAGEKSPYLLQHAGNPVEWFPWGPEAFEKAHKENKPIFLSIGYSTCHWCHVMAHESFEDPEVAKLMNETFVSIKVDREERPDIDSTYMTICQILTGRGGWPLTILITPDKKPFFAGTYFPKQSRLNLVGMLDLIPQIKKVWETRHDELTRSAEEIVHQLSHVDDHPPVENLDEPVLEMAYQQLDQRFDEGYGGFGHAPKFPTPHNFFLLLRTWKRTGKERPLRMVERSLQQMRRGGIYDHLGFGFHRYSVDREWLVPHFEKMLYDQAMLAMAYTELYQATRKEEYAHTVREIFTYVLRDLADPGGGFYYEASETSRSSLQGRERASNTTPKAFYSSEDADSEGEEGKFYLWEENEIKQILSSEEVLIINQVFNLQPEGNFHEESTGQKTGKNILCLTDSSQKLISTSSFEKARKKLFEARKKRIRPHRDDKILTDWNGLLIAALGKAARALDEPGYVEAAESALRFIFTHLQNKDRRLLHRYRDGEAAVSGFLDDYAFLTWGLIELYEATFNATHLEKALELNDTLIRHFWDNENGGFYFTAEDGENVLVRKKDVYDGAVPSGNSIALLNLLRLSRMTGRSDLEEKASQLSHVFAPLVSHAPAGYTQFLAGIDFSIDSAEVVLVGELDSPEMKSFLKPLKEKFLPNTTILLRAADSENRLTQLAPFVKELKSLGGKATAYVCSRQQCHPPTSDPGEMLALLNPEKKPA